MSKERMYTNAEIIAELQKLDPNAPAEVSVGTFTTRYPVGYLRPWVYNGRICVSFPEGYSVHKRRGAKEL